ncbi:uncharacterized protein LOC143370914 [Andrena cerasifolii]|uniref:uncharacterized protein LOC143370914 n=1 Tax=Andrena cerasifolii TaxID=2819439 RepID=UPI004037D942
MPRVEKRLSRVAHGRYIYYPRQYERNVFLYKEQIFVRCIADLEETELVHLSQKLSPLECLQLLNALYELAPVKVAREVKSHDALNENLSQLTPTSKECLVNLEQWNDESPKNAEVGGRSTMEMSLRWLGRPDLAKYVRETRRSIKFLDTVDYDIADTLEFPGHRVSRRHTPKNDKHSSAEGKKKKRKEMKRGHPEHSQSSATRNKGVHRVAAAATGHYIKELSFAKRFSRKAHKMKKKEDKSKKKKDYLEQHRSICCSILVVLLFLTLCLVAVYFLRKRNRSMARGTRFKYNFAENKQDKDTFTDHLEWNDEAVCSCSDVEGGCTEKCQMCSRNDQTHDAANHQAASHLSATCLQKPKGRKEKRRQRFSFLQRTFQDRKREKDQENQDRKKTLEKSVGKKREKLPSVFHGDYRQCTCCKCNLSSIEKMLREKRENEKKGLYRLKAKRKKKKEKKKRNEEFRRIEKHGDACYRDTCK